MDIALRTQPIVRVVNMVDERYLQRDTDNVWKLDFDKVWNMHAEIGLATVLVRSRTRKLQQNFKRDARWALNWFSVATLCAGAAVLVVSVLGVFANVKKQSFRVDHAYNRRRIGDSCIGGSA